MYELNSIINLEENILNLTKQIYIEKGKSENYLPNSLVKLDNRVCGMLGLSRGTNNNFRKHKIKTILRVSGFPYKDPYIIEMLSKKYGILKTNEEIKLDEKNKFEEDYIEFSSNFIEKYIEFLSSFLSRKQIINKREEVEEFYKAFNKPKKYMLLSSFALYVLKDTHGFDKGNYMRGWLDKLLIFLYGDNDLANHNLYSDPISNNVFTRNIVVDSNNVYDIISLIDVDNVNLVKNKNVYVIENSGVLEAIRNINNEISLVCTAGFPNLAVEKIIKRLFESNNKIFYSGDIDFVGLKIADNFLRKFPKTKIMFMNRDIYIRNYEKSIKSPKKQVVNYINDKNLKELGEEIKKCKKIINQEEFISLYKNLT